MIFFHFDKFSSCDRPTRHCSSRHFLHEIEKVSNYIFHLCPAKSQHLSKIHFKRFRLLSRYFCHWEIDHNKKHAGNLSDSRCLVFFDVCTKLIAAHFSFRFLIFIPTVYNCESWWVLPHSTPSTNHRNHQQKKFNFNCGSWEDFSQLSEP